MDTKITYNPDRTINNVVVFVDVDKTLTLSYTVKNNKDAINVTYTDSTLLKTINQTMTLKELSSYLSVLLAAHKLLPEAKIDKGSQTDYISVWDEFTI